jgi:hypothetical protein
MQQPKNGININDYPPWKPEINNYLHGRACVVLEARRKFELLRAASRHYVKSKMLLTHTPRWECWPHQRTGNPRNYPVRQKGTWQLLRNIFRLFLSSCQSPSNWDLVYRPTHKHGALNKPEVTAKWRLLSCSTVHVNPDEAPTLTLPRPVLFKVFTLRPWRWR